MRTLSTRVFGRGQSAHAHLWLGGLHAVHVVAGERLQRGPHCHHLACVHQAHHVSLRLLLHPACQQVRALQQRHLRPISAEHSNGESPQHRRRVGKAIAHDCMKFSAREAGGSHLGNLAVLLEEDVEKLFGIVGGDAILACQPLVRHWLRAQKASFFPGRLQFWR